MPATRAERLTEFFKRLAAAPAAMTGDEAFHLVADTLNAVEHAMSGVLFDPSKWATDGRLYPPQADAARPVPGKPGVVRYRSRGHSTYIGSGGAIEIREPNGTIILSRPGADGSRV